MKKSKKKTIAKALGSSRTFSVKNIDFGSPLSWLSLANEIREKLVSSGGRPSNPCWEIKRLVPFQRKIWEYLSGEAKVMSNNDRKVGPAQLAALIIESSLKKPASHSQNYKQVFNINQYSQRFIQKSDTNAVGTKYTANEMKMGEMNFISDENKKDSYQLSITNNPNDLIRVC